MEGDQKKEKSTGKALGDGLLIAFSMYSRIPVPRTKWSREGMKYALCFFPAVGLVIGLAMTAYSAFASRLGLGKLAFSCVGTVIPILLTGGIHMDGLLDVIDACSSFQSKERKLEILKDPHTGAFAIIGCGVYLLLYLAVFSELKERAYPAAAGIYVLERALSGWSVVSFPRAKKDGLASTFADQAQKRAVQISMILWAMAATLFLVRAGSSRAGGIAIRAAFAVFGWYYRMAVREFGGITGDMAGCFLQLCELTMLGVLAFF